MCAASLIPFNTLDLECIKKNPAHSVVKLTQFERSNCQESLLLFERFMHPGYLCYLCVDEKDYLNNNDLHSEVHLHGNNLHSEVHLDSNNLTTALSLHTTESHTALHMPTTESHTA